VRAPFPVVVFELFGLAITDTVLLTLVIAIVIIGGAAMLMRVERWRSLLEMLYEGLSKSIRGTVSVDVEELVPLILTLWLFIGFANLVGLVPGLKSPTGDLSLSAALASVAFFAGHVFAFRQEGLRYFKHYLEPTPWLLPLNILSELSRTLALALRLFGNALSGNLIAAIAVYLAGLLLPVPLMVLSLLTGLVQAYIFGILTLVFAAGSVASVQHRIKGASPS
jgi:F-type H+-transporting ATPase subunit a